VSRIGKLPIEIEKGAQIKIMGKKIEVSGPKGNLDYTFNPGVNVAVEDNKIVVTRESDSKSHRSLHGLTRALIANMIIGVTKGFEKKLLIEGVGYRAELKGKSLRLLLGYSHDIVVMPAPGISVKVMPGNKITISGYDKQLVGETAALVRSFRPPEPFKGKGIRYEDEIIRRKAGKTAGA